LLVIIYNYTSDARIHERQGSAVFTVYFFVVCSEREDIQNSNILSEMQTVTKLFLF